MVHKWIFWEFLTERVFENFELPCKSVFSLTTALHFAFAKEHIGHLTKAKQTI